MEADFAAGKGNTVKVRVPGAVAAQTRSIYDTATPLVCDEIAEHRRHPDRSRLRQRRPLRRGPRPEIDSYASQVLYPQATAIVKHIEKTVASTMKATPEAAAITYDAAAPAKTFTQIRKALRDNGVPTEAPLLAAVGSGVYADLLGGSAGT